MTRWKSRDEAFMDVALGIREAIKGLGREESISTNPTQLAAGVPTLGGKPPAGDPASLVPTSTRRRATWPRP